MTKSGIEHDLTVSPYFDRVYYGGKVYEYYFSSGSGLARFQREKESNRDFIKTSLEQRFKIKFHIGRDFCDMQLYRRIESRGFRVVVDGRNYTCLDEMQYNGHELEEIS